MAPVLALLACVLVDGCGARLGSAQLQAARARAGAGLVGAGPAAGGAVPAAAGGAAAGGAAEGGAAAAGNGASAGVGAAAASGSGGSGAGVTAGSGLGSPAGGGVPAAAGGGAGGAGGAGQASPGQSPGSSAVDAFSGPPAGGNGGSTDVGVTASQIDLGNVATVGGPVPGLFQGAYSGALAYASYVNSLGGIYGRRLVLHTADDQLQAAQNKAAIDSQIPKVLAFLGSFSVVDDAGAPDMQAAGVPDVGEGLTQTRLRTPTNFSVAPIGSGWAIGSLAYFQQHYGPAVTGKLAFLIEDVPAAIGVANQEQAALTHLGYKIAYSRKVEATETNFQGDVRNMQQAGIKMLIFQGEVTTLARMASAMHDASFSIPLADWGAPAYDQTFIQLSNGGAEGAILNQQLAMYGGEDAGAVPEVALFNTWLKRVAPGETPDLYAAYGWASGALLTKALIAAGPRVTRKGLLAALGTIHAFDDNGMFATADPAGKKSPTCWIAIDVKGGKFVRDPVDPPTGYVCNPGGYYPPQ